MSYILDALRKSERQRPPGPVPDLFSIQGPEPPLKRRLPAKALSAALVAGCAGVLAVWAALEVGGTRRDPLQAAARAPGLVAQTPATELEQTPEMEPAPEPMPEPAQAPEPAPEPAPLPEPAPEPTGQPGELPPAAAPSPMPPAPPAAPAAPPAAMPESAPDSGTPPVPESPALQPPAPEPAAAEEPAPAAPVEAPDPVPPDDRIVEFAELPPAIRQRLPELVISGHVWSDDAALRLLTLKDRVVREGGEAAPGVHLEQITPSGAVFVFRAWRFSVAVF